MSDLSPAQPVADQPAPLPPLRQRLQSLATIYGRLGCLGFGGPLAHIAMQNDEIVTRRGWLTQAEFAEGIAICEMLPGPASTQVSIYVGYVRAKYLGALTAGLSFILPAFLIEIFLSWAYFRYQAVPQVQALFLGVSPVVVAIIAGFCLKLAKKTVWRPDLTPTERWGRFAIGLVAFGLSVATATNLVIIFLLAGAVGAWLYGTPPSQDLKLSQDPKATQDLPPQSKQALGWVSGLGGSLAPLIASVPGGGETLSLASFWGWERVGEYAWPLVLFFIKTGAMVFGGGLVIIPFIENEVVEHMGWLTTTEFIHGVAIGQLSPGPVVLTAAFIGFKVAGVIGATLAAIAIFLPSFVFILGAAPLLQRWRRLPRVKGFLQGLLPAVLGAILAATIPLTQAAIAQASPGQTVGLVILGLVAWLGLTRYKVATWLLVLGGSLSGLLLSLVP